VVQEDLAQRSAANHDRAQTATNGRPNIVRRADRHSAVCSDDWAADRVVEGERVVADAVVDREGRLGGTVELVGHNPVTERQLRNGRHTGAESVVGVCDIVDGCGPVEEVGGGLVDKLLAMGRVALVGVVAY